MNALDIVCIALFCDWPILLLLFLFLSALKFKAIDLSRILKKKKKEEKRSSNWLCSLDWSCLWNKQICNLICTKHETVQFRLKLFVKRRDLQLNMHKTRDCDVEMTRTRARSGWVYLGDNASRNFTLQQESAASRSPSSCFWVAEICSFLRIIHELFIPTGSWVCQTRVTDGALFSQSSEICEWWPVHTKQLAKLV